MFNSLFNHSQYFSAPVKGYETIWIVGDKLVSATASQFLQLSLEDSYIRKNFNVKMYSKTEQVVNNSPISHFRNAVIKAMNDQTLLLLKIILIIPDNDLCRNLDIEEWERSIVFSEVVEWLVREIHRAVLAHKDNLPVKAILKDYPKVIWMKALLHDSFPDNAVCRKFNSALEKSVKFYSEMQILKMKKIWQSDDTSLVTQNGRITAKGISKYWLSVDSAIQFWNTNFGSKSSYSAMSRAPRSSYLQREVFDSHSRFRVDRCSELPRRCLPTPPLKKI